MSWEIGVIHAVVGIIKNADKILLAQRPLGKSYSGYWEFPGGKIEKNETSLDALKRELHEELGIEVTHAEYWFEHTHQYVDKNVVLKIFFVNNFSGNLICKEHQNLCWATIEEMQNYKLLEGNWEIINRLK